MSAPKPQSKAGFVYVLSNESMPGIVKIGMTTRDPDVRLREINSATGVLPFVIEAVIASRNAKWTEREVHERLAARRVNKNREFFRIELAEAKKTIFDVARQQRQRAYSRGHGRLAPAAAATLAMTIVPAVALIHPYLVPGWLLLCLAAAFTGRPRMIREFLGVTQKIAPAIATGILMSAGAFLITGVIGHDSLAEAASALSEMYRNLIG
jgi:hypothetical protein